MRRLILPLLVISVLSLGACAVHKIDIQQGNVITREMVETLTPGMDKRRVQLVIGSPMIQDPFHPDRWDYVYSFKAGMRDLQQSAHVVLRFDGNVLASIEVVKPPPAEKDILKPDLRSLRR